MEEAKDGNNAKGVRVVVRVRPLGSDGAHGCGEEPSVETRGDTAVELTDRRFATPEVATYAFPAVYGPEATQEQVYAGEVAALVEKVAAGNGACLFAFGATGTGKTHTLQGCSSSASGNDGAGMIPRAATALLEHEHVTALSVSFVEVYNERLFDLLGATEAVQGDVADIGAKPRRTALNMLEHSKGAVSMPGRTQCLARSAAEFMAVYRRGVARRTTGETTLNKHSSRSHALLSIKAELLDGRHGVLHVIDLAGNEDNRRTGNTGKRLVESSAINQSLFVLGKVIRGLNTGASRIAFRDSKLTRLLQHTLTCSHAAVMMCTVTPWQRYVAHTKYTLNYAAKAAAMKVSCRRSAATTPHRGADGRVAPTPSRQEQWEAWRREQMLRGRTPADKKTPRQMLRGRTPADKKTPRHRTPLLSRMASRRTPQLGSAARRVRGTPASTAKRPRPEGVRSTALSSARGQRGTAAARCESRLEQDIVARSIAVGHALSTGGDTRSTPLSESTRANESGAAPTAAKGERDEGAASCGSMAGSAGRASALLSQAASLVPSATAAMLKRLNTQVKAVLEMQLVQTLNRGDEAALRALKGIGPKRAAAIIARRTESPFEKLEDLQCIGMSGKLVSKFARDNVLSY